MLPSPGFRHLPAVLTEHQRAGLHASIDRMIDGFDVAASTAVFSTAADAQTRDRYFLDSARGVAPFLEAGCVDASGALTRPKAECINKIGHALHDHDEAFAALGRHPAVVAALRQLADEPWALMQSMVIMKPPGIGGEVRWHQDGTFLSDQPESVIGFWFALEDATPENACLQFKVDGHLDPLSERYRVEHADGSNRFEALAPLAWPDADGSQTQYAPCKAGDALMFGGRIAHASSTNQSSRSRRAITLHFRRAATDWCRDNWLQRAALPDFLV